MAQGEPPPVSQQAGRGAAQLLKGAVGLPGPAPVPAVSRLEVGGIGDDQVEPASRQGHLPPVRLEDRPLQAAVDQVLPGTLGRPLLPLHSREREPPSRAASIRSRQPLPVPRSHTRQPRFTVAKAPQGPRLSPPQGKDPLLYLQKVGAQVLRPAHPISPPAGPPDAV